jgi:hypothetical protein
LFTPVVRPEFTYRTAAHAESAVSEVAAMERARRIPGHGFFMGVPSRGKGTDEDSNPNGFRIIRNPPRNYHVAVRRMVCGRARFEDDADAR